MPGYKNGMTKVVLDISMSLDGYVTGPGAGPTNGLGDGGDALHTWVFDGKSDADAEILRRALERTGAVVMGRRTYDVVDGPRGWGDERAFGGEPGETRPPPNIVVTHHPPGSVRLAGIFTFVMDGLDVAIDRAREVAGDRDVTVMGGASVIDQCLSAGLGDELWIHLAPVLLGACTRLFAAPDPGSTDLDQLEVVVTPSATHLHYLL